ncbi:hypothetical protein NBG4_10052 [Candidatus Sulfobium mesophilum]|uniref:Uncharacterized protein n=1 Tax=Candidatus Sulfobium mesophilum TaxID=2016548 RepID=A0A2U3QDL4_9BACT|nr:hypothetical protein NBG4_10052 [Candidatus Sulfobium mesophilum]
MRKPRSQHWPFVVAAIVFVHPRGFLVTGPSGEILERSEFGGTAMNDDKNRPLGGVVRFYELELRHGLQKSSGAFRFSKVNTERVAK